MSERSQIQTGKPQTNLCFHQYGDKCAAKLTLASAGLLQKASAITSDSSSYQKHFSKAK